MSDTDSFKQKDKKHSSVDHSFKQNRKNKSSGTVVIRNINYISSKRKDSNKGGVYDESSSNVDLNEYLLGEKVKNTNGSFEMLHKSKEPFLL